MKAPVSAAARVDDSLIDSESESTHSWLGSETLDKIVSKAHPHRLPAQHSEIASLPDWTLSQSSMFGESEDEDAEDSTEDAPLPRWIGLTSAGKREMEANAWVLAKALAEQEEEERLAKNTAVEETSG